MRGRVLILLILLAALALVVRQNATSSTVDSAELQRLLEAGASLQVVDVREPHEFSAGHIPGAKLIPLQQLKERMHELDPNLDIVVVCRTGNRSSQATALLIKERFNAKNLEGGMVDWKGEVIRP